MAVSYAEVFTLKKKKKKDFKRHVDLRAVARYYILIFASLIRGFNSVRIALAN